MLEAQGCSNTRLAFIHLGLGRGLKDKEGTWTNAALGVAVLLRLTGQLGSDMLWLFHVSTCLLGLDLRDALAASVWKEAFC